MYKITSEEKLYSHYRTDRGGNLLRWWHEPSASPPTAYIAVTDYFNNYVWLRLK